MSVIEAFRNESDVYYVHNARELSKFTDSKCKNFPNRWNRTYTEKLEFYGMRIYSLVFAANNLDVYDNEEYRERAANLNKAKKMLFDMVALIAVADELFPLSGYLKKRRNESDSHLERRQRIKSNRILEEWMSYIDYEIMLIKKVMKSDRKRRSERRNS